MKLVGKPDAGNRHVRFDERGQETECCHMAQATAPVLDSTRRAFMSLLGGAAAWPLAARAQQPERMRRIGVLIHLAESDPEGQARLGAFRDGLGKPGWQVGGNLSIDYRWKASNDHQARAAVAEWEGRWFSYSPLSVRFARWGDDAVDRVLRRA